MRFGAISARELVARVQTHLQMSQLRKEAEEAIRKLAETLESEVRERTKQLEDRNSEVLRQSETGSLTKPDAGTGRRAQAHRTRIALSSVSLIHPQVHFQGIATTVLEQERAWQGAQPVLPHQSASLEAPFAGTPAECLGCKHSPATR